MKPLLVSLEYPPHSFGGVGSHVFNLARCLAERHIQCAVLSPGPSEGESTADGVTHFTTPISDTAGLKLLSFAAGVPRCLSRIRRAFEFDIVHSHFGPCAFAGSRSLRGVPMVETAHGTHYGELLALSPLSRLTPREAVGKYTVYPALSFLDLLCYRRASAIIAVSPLARSEVSRYGRGLLKKTVMIPNGIRLSEFAPSERAAPPEDGVLRCLCVAFMQARKGLDYLLEACGRLAAEGALAPDGWSTRTANGALAPKGVPGPGRGPGSPRISLTIVGDGPHVVRLKTKALDLGISDSVRFAGRLDRESLRREFAGADAFVLPSLWEGQGIVFLEAMASGLPIVATRIPGVEGMLEHGVNALLVPPRDPVTLAGAMLELARSRELRSRLSSEGLKRVKRFDWNQLVGEVISLYASVLGGRV
jgi:phosphatidylinositol alpha-1,6-mannosyltransferase